MHSFENAENFNKKKDNWNQLQVFFERRKIPIVLKNTDSLILNENDVTLEFVRQIYTLLTERQLMPPIKLYELQQPPAEGAKSQASKREAPKPKQEDEAKKEDTSAVLNQSTSKSPHKTLAIKGPPKVINEKLDIDGYQGVKVTDINVRPLN